MNLVRAVRERIRLYRLARKWSNLLRQIDLVVPNEHLITVIPDRFIVEREHAGFLEQFESHYGGPEGVFIWVVMPFPRFVPDKKFILWESPSTRPRGIVE